MKFVVNYDLLPPGVDLEYSETEQTVDSPFSKELLGFNGINRVFITGNFITLNKTADGIWDDLIFEIRPFIKAYLEQGKYVISSLAEDAGEEELAGNELERKIVSILDEYIKPAVEMDGGAIIFKSFEKGTLKVQLKGSCSGCPSSSLTLKSGIENLMKRMVPEVEMVEAEDS